MIKNRRVTTIFIGIQVLFVVLYIHKSSRFVQESYRMQHNDTCMKQLERAKQNLLYSLSALQNLSGVQKYARNSLGMRSITLNQINKLSS